MTLNKNTQKGLYIKNFGCQMNVYDGNRMQEMMSSHNYDSVNTIEDADLIILNTCHIREKATEKIYSELGRIKKNISGKKKRTTIAVAGCVAQAEGQELIKRAPIIDLVFGPLTYHHLPNILQSFEKDNSIKKKAIVDIEPPSEDKFTELPKRLKEKQTISTFLSVQEGCDKFCTFCVVPYTRGVETSRSFLEIKDEAKELISNGVQEIILLGQNVNAWSSSNNNAMDFADLIYELSLLEIKRIRFTTSHPNDMNHKLISSFRDIEKLQPYLHLPIQSGSDKVLKNMNRNYSSEEYIEIISELKSIRPDIAISGDFIVGFPGETEDDFNKTEEIVRKIGYAHAYSFKYSPRPGTPAGQMKDQIDEKIKSERLQRLQHVIKQSMYNYNKKFLNQSLQVLVEKETSPGFFSGRSPYLQSIHFQSNKPCIGNIVDIKILKVNDNSLSGEIFN
tara:strand:- start:11478 stop:12824 length:1347 start_codon:yes stop_codon:yes gene_type:complete